MVKVLNLGSKNRPLKLWKSYLQLCIHELKSSVQGGEKIHKLVQFSGCCDPEKVKNRSAVSLSIIDYLLLLLQKKHKASPEKSPTYISRKSMAFFSTFIHSVYSALLLAPHTHNRLFSTCCQTGRRLYTYIHMLFITRLRKTLIM